MRDKNKTVQSVCVSCLSVCVCVYLSFSFSPGSFSIFLLVSHPLALSICLSCCLTFSLSLHVSSFGLLSLCLSVPLSHFLSLSPYLSYSLSLSLSQPHTDARAKMYARARRIQTWEYKNRIKRIKATKTGGMNMESLSEMGIFSFWRMLKILPSLLPICAHLKRPIPGVPGWDQNAWEQGLYSSDSDNL